MSKFLYTIILITILQSSCKGYYWRTWDGTVPEDVVEGGSDSRGPYYVSRAWVPNQGIYVAQAFYGDTEVQVAYSIKDTDIANSSTVEVLCSDLEEGHRPFWLASTQSISPVYIAYDIARPVIAGKTSAYDHNEIYIGKHITQTFSYIGSVHTDFDMYYVNEDGEWRRTDIYEFLVLDVNHATLKKLTQNVTDNVSEISAAKRN